MKARIFVFILILLNSNSLFSTNQVSDILYYGEEKLMVDIGWGHPSPLETYYQQNNIKYPFKILGTANYRGHIASWKIEGNKFFITRVTVGKKDFKPKKFKIQSKEQLYSSKGKIFADWFNGVIVCQNIIKKNYWETGYSYYFLIKKGVIQKSERITNQDLKKIHNINEKNTSNIELLNKRTMLKLNRAYISFYFRLYDKEKIKIKEKTNYVSYISGKYGGSIILEYFDFHNEHMNWVYNWENHELNGAPNGVWEIKEKKLFLDSINLHTGFEFKGPQKTKVELTKIFPNKVNKNERLLADWTNGIYIIVHGQEVTEEIIPEYFYKSFKEIEYTILRINKGLIEESYTISKDFNFDDIPKNTDKKLKKLIEDFQGQKKKN